MPNRIIFDEKEMIIITVKYIVIVAFFLTICSIHTCIQTVSLLSLQRMIKISLPFMA